MGGEGGQYVSVYRGNEGKSLLFISGLQFNTISTNHSKRSISVLRDTTSTCTRVYIGVSF